LPASFGRESGGRIPNRTEETIMITYRPVAPLTVGSGTLRSVLAAMAAAAFLGTAAFGAEAGKNNA
jgi:hypothetical protein